MESCTDTWLSANSPPTPWVIIGNPNNRRISHFQDALARCGMRPAKVISYWGLLTGKETLGDLPPGAVVRFESPGENFEVERELLAWGAEAAAQEGSPFMAGRQLDNFTEDRGRILFPRQSYLGFIAATTRWINTLRQRSDLTVTTSAHDLRILFDKTLCQQRFAMGGVPVPQTLGSIKSWDQLVDKMDSVGRDRIFLKLANGSSASGVVALHRARKQLSATTTVEMVRHAGQSLLYNSLKIRRYTCLEDVQTLVDSLAPHRVHVEEWLPKATVDRRVCDLRILTIAGLPKHIVVRTSRGPLTNLHLGNRRLDRSSLHRKIEPCEFELLEKTCRGCADLFPDSFQLGLDVLYTPGFKQHFVLEANAFGDLLPGVLHDGLTTHEAEVVELQRSGWRPTK